MSTPVVSTGSSASKNARAKLTNKIHDIIGPIRSEKSPAPTEGDVEKAQEIRMETEKIRKSHWYDGFVRLFVWYPSFMPKEEKWLLFKLDVVLLLYVCSSYFTKSLDKSNLVKAYNSGMDQDINFKGNDLSYAKSLYSAGYIVSMCFGIMLLTRPWARLALPVLETIWGVLTFCEAVVTTSNQMFALRFLIGLAEGPIFPSVVYTIGSWYKRDELYRRVMAFSITSGLGSIFSGFLQSAAFQNLNGKGGMAGWQWGFIIDGIFTVPIALIGFAVYPGTLEQSANTWWLSSSEKELSRRRMHESGVRPIALKLNLNLLTRTFTRWHIHFFATFWVLLNVLALPDGVGFDLWLKANGVKNGGPYTESNQVNYPSIQSAVGIVGQFLLAGLADTFSPYIFLTITQLLFIISYSSLVAWDIPVGWRWVCYMIIGLDSTNQALISGIINRTVRRDAEERALVIGYSDAVSQAINIWTNIVFFPTKEAPRFHKGYIASLVGTILMLFLPIPLWFGERYDTKKYALEDVEYAETYGISPVSGNSGSDGEERDQGDDSNSKNPERVDVGSLSDLSNNTSSNEHEPKQ